MKKSLICLGAGLFIGLAASSARATVNPPYFDAFNYAEGNLNAVGGPNWVLGSGSSTFEIAVSNTAALTAPAGFPAASGKGLRRAPSSSSKRTVLQFTSVPATDGNTLFVSFLLNVPTAPAAAQLIGHLNDSNASDSTPQAGIFVDAGPKVGVGKITSTPGFTMSTNLGAGPHLIVVRYLFQAGNDRVDLWVDPATASYGAVSAPASLGSTAGSGDPASLDYFQFITSSTAGGVQFIDEFRLGTAWADVVPSAGAPFGQQLSFTTQPTDTLLGATLSPVVVQVQSAGSVSVASNGVPVTVTLSSGSGNLGGTTTRNTDATGKATFNDLTIDTIGAGKQFTAGASGIGAGLAAAVSSAFAITNVAVVTNTLPVITQVQWTPGGIALRGNNGPSNGVYRVVNSTNVTLPRSQWTVIATNVFDAAGNFASTNPLSLNSGAKFYCVLLGGQLSSAPAITAQPQNQSVTVSNSTGFSVVASGAGPLQYQWYFNTNTALAGATNSLFTLTAAQFTDAGGYSVIVTNNYGAATSSIATLTVSAPLTNNAQFNLVGFGQNATGGGMIADTDPAYTKVTNALQLATAVLAFNKTGGIKVIEIMNDLDLGWNEVGSNVQNLASTPFTEHNPAKLHPKLLATSVSKMDIKYKSGGLTIFSANGATIRHCTFNIKSTHNIIVRNLKFDEMWEWDETSKGGYDGNDWDYIDLANGGDVYDVWIDHCTFTKAYDGIVDFKAGSTNVTLSWCKYTGDDGATNPNSFVWQQINSLESNKNSYAFYGFLRNNGFSTTNIVTIIQGHDKTHLMGSNDKDTNNVRLSATFHHLWMKNCWDRAVPRLRAGNVHDFNIYVDDTDALAAKRLRDAVQLTMSSSSSNALDNTYSFDPPLNGSISTEGGAVLVEKSVYIDCLYPLRNNQTDVTDPAYTGKILGADLIYQMDSTVVRGNSTDAGSPLGPFQAPIISFSWNPLSGAPGGVLPYTYTMDDPSQLQSIVTNYTGAGILTWGKTNWLKTSY